MTITNGTFDTDLSGWTISTTGSGQIFWNGLGRFAEMKLIGQPGCGSASMEQTILIDGQTLSFWRSARNERSIPATPKFELIVDGNVVIQQIWTLVGSGSITGTVNIDITQYLGKVATLRFSVIDVPNCTDLETVLLVDDVMITNPGNVSTVIFNTNPQNADIFVNGFLIGKTPLTVNYLLGTYDYILRYPCYEDITGQLTVSQGGVVPIDKIFTKNTGDISINSTPSSNIYLDGVLRGMTPLNLTCQPERIYQYVLTLSNYQSYNGSLLVKRNLTATANITLLPLGPVGTGSISIISGPPGANITVDNVQTGQITPYSFSNLSIGSHSIKLELSGYKTYNTTVTVIESNTIEINVVLIPSGSITFSSYPVGARIYLDGIDTGLVTPVNLTEVEIGEHTYRISLPNFNDITGNVTIFQNQTTEVDLTLIPNEGCIYFDSNPQGAEIWLDDTIENVSNTGFITPAIICDLPLGVHAYKLIKTGYQDIIGSIDLLPGEGGSIFNTMTLLGVLEITSSPTGATIYIDDTIIGTTPLNISLTPEIYTYGLTLSGYQDVTGDVEILPGQTTTLTIDLIPVGGLGLLLLGGLAIGFLLFSRRPKQEVIIRSQFR